MATAKNTQNVPTFEQMMIMFNEVKEQSKQTDLKKYSNADGRMKIILYINEGKLRYVDKKG